jgi:hypothetical protein
MQQQLGNKKMLLTIFFTVPLESRRERSPLVGEQVNVNEAIL